MLSSGSGPCSYIHVYVYVDLRTATQTFNGLDASKFRKTCQEKEGKKKKKGLQHMYFAAWLQMGREVGNICISIATLKVRSPPSLFPSFRSANYGNSFSLRDLPPDVIASLLPSWLEAFPKQRLKVALNCAEMVVLVLNCLLSLGADLKNKLVLRWRNPSFPWKANGRKEGFLQGKELIYDCVTHNLGKTSNIY